MRAFTPVRFVEEPLTQKVHCQMLCTWGDDVRHLYSDFWEWGGASLRYLLKNSIARPVVWEIVE